MVEYNNQILTEDEAALYDRQIRLWGLDAQKRLRAAKVLVIGACGLGAEIIKNLVLAGVKSLEILDHRNVTQLDTHSNFLVPHDCVGKNIAIASLNRAQILNPMVEITSDTEKVEDKPDEFFELFDVVCMCRATPEQLLRVDAICQQYGNIFYAGDVYGMHGYMFANLNEHSYVEEVKEKAEVEQNGKKEIVEETKLVKKTDAFVPLSDALDVDWSSEKYAKRLKRTSPSYFILHILQEFEILHKRRPDPAYREMDEIELLTIKNALLDKMNVPQEKVSNNFVNHIFGQVSPACAIVGGVLAQEVIKAVSKKDPPLNNFFFFSPDDCSGIVECIGI